MGTAFLRQLQQEFKGYNGQKLAKDLMAGLTVAAVALPLALAVRRIGRCDGGLRPGLRRLLPVLSSRR